MEIVTLQDYMELVLGVKTVEEITKKNWYEIAMMAKDGFNFDIELIKMKEEMDKKNNSISATIKEKPSKELEISKKMDQQDDVNELPVDLTF